jgi:hypothetical protein
LGELASVPLSEEALLGLRMMILMFSINSLTFSYCSARASFTESMGSCCWLGRVGEEASSVQIQSSSVDRFGFSSGSLGSSSNYL